MSPSRNGQAKLRCGIYTRKSSDEGLDGDFQQVTTTVPKKTLVALRVWFTLNQV